MNGPLYLVAQAALAEQGVEQLLGLMVEAGVPVAFSEAQCPRSRLLRDSPIATNAIAKVGRRRSLIG
jgi:hypothetical protein